MSDLGNKAIMAKNIQRLMSKAGKTRLQVCDDLGIAYTTFTDWVKGNRYPRIDKIEMMANYFGVPKSELVEDPEKFPPSAIDRETELLFESLSPDRRQEALRYLRYLSEQAQEQQQ